MIRWESRQCPDWSRDNGPTAIGPILALTRIERMPRQESRQCPVGYLANEPMGITSMLRLESRQWPDSNRDNALKRIEPMPGRELGQCPDGNRANAPANAPMGIEAMS